MAHETVIRSSLILNDVQNSTAPATNFLVLSGATDLVTTRTAAQMLNDIFPLSGSANQVAYWNSSSGITGNNNFWWNNSSQRLGIGTSSPNQTLEVAGTMRLTGSTGTGTTLMARNANGDISAISVNSGLSLSGNTLTSTNGLPASGLTGQILAKNSGSNYDVSWVDNITAVQHMQQYIKNNQGATVSKGQAVYIDGADGTNATIKLAQADSEATSSKTLGLLEQDLAINAKGYVVTEGLLSGINTSGANAEGDPVWLDPNNAGGLIFGLTNKPVAPAHLVYLGVVIRKNNVNGEIYVKVQNGYELQELHNVLIPSSVTNNDVLAYETSTSLWKNKSFSSLGLVSGTGTTNYIPKWNSGTSLADSVIFQSGTSVGIGTTTLRSDRLDIQGTTASQGGQIGAELATTGTLGTGWAGTSFATGYTKTAGTASNITTTLAAVSGSPYQLVVTMTGRTAGTCTVTYGGLTTGGLTASGSLPQTLTTSTATMLVSADAAFDGMIVISVKRITASTMATFALKNSSGTVVYEQRAGASNTNVFQGVGAGALNTTGTNNVFISYLAGASNTTATQNAFVGSLAGSSNVTGSYNSFFGAKSGYNNYNGIGNSFFGFECGLGWNYGSYNSLFGINSMAGTNTGSENTAIGYLSGRYTSNGTTSNSNCSNSVFIGSLTKSLASAQSNQTVIGYNAIGFGSNTTVIGNSNTIQTWLGGKLSVGTTSNTAYLNVQGSGSTSATTAVNVQNSSATALLTIKDDGTTQVTGTLRLTGSIGTGATLMARDANGDVSAISVGSGLSLSENTLTSTGGGGGGISGTGTTNYIPKWNSGTSLADSVIFQSGTSVGIGTTTLRSDRLDIQGTTASERGQIGAELMTTGAGTNWNGTSFVSGYTHTTGNTAALTSTISVSSNSYYQIIYTISGRTNGTVTVFVGGISSGAVSVSGLLQSVTNTTAVTITPTTDFNGTIILSVKLITASIATFVMKNTYDDVVYEQRANISWDNIFQGVESGQYNTSGVNNVFLGRRVGRYNTTGSGNVFQGGFAGGFNTIGSYNVYQGVYAGAYNTTGSYNVFIGYQSGALYGLSGSIMKTADNSVLFGYGVRTLADGETNATVIGYQAIGLGSNTTVIGNSNTIQTWLGGKLSVGTTSNTAYLNVQGSGSTSATTAVNVQNSSATALLTIKDDGTTQVTGTLRLTGSIGTGATLMARDANGDVSAISVGSGLSLSENTLTSTGGGGGGISGTGTTNYIPKWNSGTSLADSVIFQSGTSVGIGTNSPTSRLQIIGTGTGTTVPLLIQNSVLTSKLTVKDNGAIEIGSNAAVTGTTTATIQVVDSSNANVGLALLPKGNGAFTLSIPDGTSAGGNSRGDYAVDFQRIRSSATQVASGGHSYIGGGERNVASGTYAIIVAGIDNLASGQNSIVIAGNTNIASGLHSIVTGGYNNRATASYAIVNGGTWNTANSAYSTINGGYGAVTTLYGQIARSSGAFGNGIFNDPAFADAQKSELILRRSITGTGSTELYLDGGSLQAILPSNNTQGILWNAKIQLAAVIQTAGTSSSVAVGDSFISEHTVGIKRIGNTCVLVGGGAVQNLMSKDTSMDTATVTIAADNTTEALTIFFKPPTTAVATTVTRVVATIYLTEVGF